MPRIDKKQLAMGMKVEQEHKDVTHGDPKLTKKIAVAHLKEVPDYYTKLKMVEKQGKKGAVMVKNQGKKKISKVMHEFKEGELHSGSKKGPKVTNPKQAVAIAISESKKKTKKRK